MIDSESKAVKGLAMQMMPSNTKSNCIWLFSFFFFDHYLQCFIELRVVARSHLRLRIIKRDSPTLSYGKWLKNDGDKTSGWLNLSEEETGNAVNDANSIWIKLHVGPCRSLQVPSGPFRSLLVRTSAEGARIKMSWSLARHIPRCTRTTLSFATLRCVCFVNILSATLIIL